MITESFVLNKKRSQFFTMKDAQFFTALLEKMFYGNLTVHMYMMNVPDINKHTFQPHIGREFGLEMMPYVLIIRQNFSDSGVMIFTNSEMFTIYKQLMTRISGAIGGVVEQNH